MIRSNINLDRETSPSCLPGRSTALRISLTRRLAGSSFRVVLIRLALNSRTGEVMKSRSHSDLPTMRARDEVNLIETTTSRRLLKASSCQSNKLLPFCRGIEYLGMV
jgi:hypothetical protein